MTDTLPSTSEGKLCASCGDPFDADDDKRFAKCAACRADAKPEVKTEPKIEPVAVEQPQPGDVEALTLDVETQKPPPVEERNFYWCGATMDCPMDIALGGLEFQRTEGEIVSAPGGQSEMRDHAKKGKILRLTETNVTLALEHCANKVIRNWKEEVRGSADGQKYHVYTGRLVGIEGKRRQFVPDPSDKPLGQFVYMIKVRHREDRPYSDPPTLIKRDW